MANASTDSFFCELPPSFCGKALAEEHSFTTLQFAQDATYKARTSLSKASVEALISRSNLNALFIPDLLGRPNYWSPELYSSFNSGGASETIGKSSFLMPWSVFIFLPRLLLPISQIRSARPRIQAAISTLHLHEIRRCEEIHLLHHLIFRVRRVRQQPQEPPDRGFPRWHGKQSEACAVSASARTTYPPFQNLLRVFSGID